ncbi:hypothetical protein ACOSQ3_022343 [Xanthoceras sorbifolium]
MLDFGEELTIDTYKIPWLIWIQILVLLLLLILLYCFSAFSLDLSHDNSNTTSSLASSSSSSSAPSSNLTHQSLTSDEPLLIKRSSQPSQVGGSQSIKGEILSTTARGTIRRRRDQEATTTTDNHQRERESASSTSTSTAINYHPCHYFKLARLAFLKCLGLDSSSENSSTPNEQRKER